MEMMLRRQILAALLLVSLATPAWAVNTWKTYTVKDGADEAIIWSTVQSDGTEETDKILVDKSALSGTFTKLTVKKLTFVPTGDSAATFTFEFDATTDDLIWAANATGPSNFAGIHLPVSLDFGPSGVVDPVSSGNTGDVVFTTTGVSASTTYSILVTVRKVP